MSASPTIRIARSSAPKVSIIIPATSGKDLLLACLNSLVGPGTAGVSFETIVVLNNATAGYREIEASVDGVRFLSSATNLGMAGAGNRGRKHARGELLVTLHDDAEVEPGWLAALVETAEQYPHAGAIGGKVLNLDGRLQSAGMILWRDATTSQPWTRAPPDLNSFNQLRAVDYCGSSSLLVRAVAWDAVGGLDERIYPAYYVDVDLSMALRARGWSVLYQPRSRIRHHQGPSTSSRFKRFISERNRQYFLDKWAEQLQGHEPPDRTSIAAIERAMARAERQALKNFPISEGADLNREAFDEEDQLRSHIERARALQEAYLAYLGTALEQEAVRLGISSALLDRSPPRGSSSLWGRLRAAFHRTAR